MGLSESSSGILIPIYTLMTGGVGTGAKINLVMPDWLYMEVTW